MIRMKKKNYQKKNTRPTPIGLVNTGAEVPGVLQGSNPNNIQQSANNRTSVTNFSRGFKKVAKGYKQRNQTLKQYGLNPSQSIMRLKEMALSSYQRALVAPEFARDAKIPALFPLPTNSVHMKTTLKFTTNALGNAAILVNPWYLADGATNANTYILINTDAALTLNSGQVLTTNFTGYSMSSRVQANDATAYRLVSASLHIYPEMSIQTAQGYIAGGIVTRGGQAGFYTVGSTGNAPFGGNAALSSVIDQALYYQKAQIGNQAGVRALYMPFDPTFEAFVTVTNGRTALFSVNCDQFFWNYYVTGTQASANMCLDIYYNFELEPAQESVLQLYTTQHMPSEGTGPAIKNLTINPELISQASPNLLTMAAEIDKCVITNRSPSFLGNAINWISNNSGDIFNVVKSLAPMFA